MLLGHCLGFYLFSAQTHAVRKNINCIRLVMLTQTKRENFEIDPAYNEENALFERINEVRDALYEELACVDVIKNMTLQKICLFSMIDQLAQEHADYPENPMMP